ncbi:MAG: hypothetical protein KatS3mg100_137 [Candidatus Parcubacteria bacterium]|jgi:hypothetical protein|nr:MAG: hypothetical protein KatS3mg100_137 [Candidatus Parcubacteria bacterium]
MSVTIIARAMIMAKITPTVRQTFLAFGEYIFGSIGGKTFGRKG